MLRIPYVEFYITNVCNLACNGCNRFNDYNFTGWQRWDDYAEIYQQWSKELIPNSMSILGGEPLLNPDFTKWLIGVTTLWPSTVCRVITNGFQLDRVKNLYSMLEKNRKIQLWVGIHNKLHKKEIINKVINFLTSPCTTKFNNDNPYMEYMDITDSNGITVRIEYNWWFNQGAIISNNGMRTLHSSDPEKAHNTCNMKTCHHFIHGKLYKCGVVALLPEFDQQHKLDLSSEDRALMQAYRPLTISDSDEFKTKFVKELPNTINQCRFCPEVYVGDQIFSRLKKDI